LDVQRVLFLIRSLGLSVAGWLKFPDEGNLLAKPMQRASFSFLFFFRALSFFHPFHARTFSSLSVCMSPLTPLRVFVSQTEGVAVSQSVVSQPGSSNKVTVERKKKSGKNEEKKYAHVEREKFSSSEMGNFNIRN